MKSTLGLKIISRPPVDKATGKVKDPADHPKLRLYAAVVRRMAKYGMSEEEAIADFQLNGSCRNKRKDGTLCGKEISSRHKVCDECRKERSAACAQEYRTRLREKECTDCSKKFMGLLKTKLCDDCRYSDEHCGAKNRQVRPARPRKVKPKPKKVEGMTVEQREKEWRSRLPANWLKPGAKPEDPPKPAPVEVPKGFKITYGPPCPGRWESREG